MVSPREVRCMESPQAHGITPWRDLGAKSRERIPFRLELLISLSFLLFLCYTDDNKYDREGTSK